MMEETYYEKLQKAIKSKDSESLKNILEMLLEENGIFLYEKPLFIRTIFSENIPTLHGYIGPGIVLELYYPSWKLTIYVSKRDNRVETYIYRE